MAEGIVVYINIIIMAVRLRYAQLSYAATPEVKPLDLTSFKEAGQAMIATADNLQARAIQNENAYNELAIKMSEYNAIQGKDEEALAERINVTQEAIKQKVDSDGGWFFADTAVTDGARQFLTDEGTKAILNSKAAYDQFAQLNEQSDAPEEYKKMNTLMALEAYNEAGGATGGAGKQSFTQFGSALGKGHDRSVYQKELLEMVKAFKADKNYIYEAFNATDLTNFLHTGLGSKETREIAQAIIAARGGNVEGFISRDKTIESLSEDKIREVFAAVLSSKPEFRTALDNEARIDLWLNKKQGGTNSSAVTAQILGYVNSNPIASKTMLENSSFKDLTKEQQAIAASDPRVLQRYVMEGMQKSMPNLVQKANESTDEYEARMAQVYAKTYRDQNIESMLTMAKIGSYTAVEAKSNDKWFPELLLDSRKAAREAIEKIQAEDTGKVGYTRANLPANAMMKVLDTNIATAQETMSNAKATMDALSDKDDDESRYNYQVAEKQFKDSEQIIRNANQEKESMFKQLDPKDPNHARRIKDLKESLVEQYVGDDADEFKAALNRLDNPSDIIDEVLKYKDKGHWEYNNTSNVVGRTILSLMGIAADPTKNIHEPITHDRLLSFFATGVQDLGIKPQSNPITLFTPLSNNKNAYSASLEEIQNLFDANPGVWNIASAALGDKVNEAKFMDDLIGQPVTASKDLVDIYGTKKSGTDDNAIYTESNRKFSIGVDASGNMFLQVTLPAQGDTRTQKTVTLYSNDDGAQAALRSALMSGAQVTYNQAQSNPTDGFQKQAANEIMAYTGNLERLGADLSNPAQAKNPELFNYNVVNGQRVANVSQAVAEIIKDKRVYPTGNYYPITTTDFRYNVSKKPTGTYTVAVDKYDPNSGTYKATDHSFTFRDDLHFSNNFPALVFKLNNGNTLIQNFRPTKTVPNAATSEFIKQSLARDPLLLNQ